MVYRHIFFLESSILKGSGYLDVEYTGRVYVNASKIKNVKTLYDPVKDLMIACTSCAKKKYRNFIKVQTKC